MAGKLNNNYPPKGLLRWFFRMPVYLYRFGLGGLMGSRMVLIHHKGRKSGVDHKAVVEVVEREPGTNTVIVVAGYGERTQWYQNLKNQTETLIQLGNREYSVAVEMISPEAGEEIIVRYMDRNPKLMRQLFSMIGYEWDGSEQGLRRIALDHLRFVLFVMK